MELHFDRGVACQVHITGYLVQRYSLVCNWYLARTSMYSCRVVQRYWLSYSLNPLEVTAMTCGVNVHANLVMRGYIRVLM